MNDEKLLFELPQSQVIEEKKFKERHPIWTECKAKLIERYLFYFVQITYHGTYIDAFSGPQEPDKPEMWAAKLVLESNPKWFRNFYLFEINPASVLALQKLKESQPPPDKSKREPKRTVEIVPGDFNLNIGRFLNENPIPDKQATFCLLDQRTFECDWASVRTVATHKKAGKKIELFYFFPEGWLNRSMHALKIDRKERLNRWWGNDDWERLLDLRGADRAQFVAKRFEAELGYKYAYAFAIYEKPDEGGKIMYYMIHASDHEAAPGLMNRAYGKALDIKERPEQLDFLNAFQDAPSALLS